MLTCKIRGRPILRCVCSGFDEFLQALVVDIRSGPFRDLVTRQVVSELHSGEPAALLAGTVIKLLWRAPWHLAGGCAKSNDVSAVVV
jgi:hypothetical protein